MKTRQINSKGMRAVLAGMVVDQTVCSRIASQWPKEGGLFDAPWANLVAGWCVDYVRKYGEPPNGKLRLLFDDWAATTKAPDETVRGVEKFLVIADQERERAEDELVNSNHILDMADRYFNIVQMRQAISNASELLEISKVPEAQSVLTNVKRVRLGSTAMVELSEDWDAWRKAFDYDYQRPLVIYPGRLQSFMGKWFQRDTLIAFMAPDKSGKSVFLLDLAVRAVRNRCRVVYFDVGDNSQEQVMQRLGSRVVRWPSADNFKTKLQVPLAVDKDGEVETEERLFKFPVSMTQSYNAVRKLCRGVKRFRLCCYPNGTASIAMIASVLADWEREDGWVPDVVVIDYADILAPLPGVLDNLDQIDETWKYLRRISQEKHCLVVTATQSSAAAYSDKAKVLKKQHFSGRKTKLAHVNGMVGINVSDNDRRNGVTRLNWVVRREGRYSENDQMIVAGCWDWYDPAVRVAPWEMQKDDDEK